MQYLQAESWNRGLGAFNDRALEEAEGWMSMSFSFCELLDNGADVRAEMSVLYQQCLQMLAANEPATQSFAKRMSRIVCAAPDPAA